MKKTVLLFVILLLFTISCQKKSDETLPDSQQEFNTSKTRKSIEYTVPPEDHRIKGPNGEPSKKKKYGENYYYGE